MAAPARPTTNVAADGAGSVIRQALEKAGVTEEATEAVEEATKRAAPPAEQNGPPARITDRRS